MKPGRPKRGESVPSKIVKTWLDPETLDEVQRRGGSPYVRELILADLEASTSAPEHKQKLEVRLPADVHARVVELGGSAYIRKLIEKRMDLGV